VNDVTYAELLDRYREELSKAQEQVLISSILLEKQEIELIALRAAAAPPAPNPD
jgi:hypothetical protein